MSVGSGRARMTGCVMTPSALLQGQLPYQVLPHAILSGKAVGRQPTPTEMAATRGRPDNKLRHCGVSRQSLPGRLLPFKRATIENLSAHCELAWRYECENPEPGGILSTSIVSQDVKPGWVPSGSTAWRGGLMYVAKGFPAIAENRRPFRQDQNPETPGIQLVPASGTRAIAAASRVSATRSSGSR